MTYLSAPTYEIPRFNLGVQWINLHKYTDWPHGPNTHPITRHDAGPASAVTKNAVGIMAFPSDRATTLPWLNTLTLSRTSVGCSVDPN